VTQEEAPPAEPYALVLARPARRALTDELAEGVAAAAWELINGGLRTQPHRVGKPLHEPFAGQWVARRSTYRVRYRIDDHAHIVFVLDVTGRADAYHTGRA
jgi:mRNA interferase RelE/StbE